MFSQDQNVGKAPSSSSLDRFRNVDMTLNATRSTSGFVLINEEVDINDKPSPRTTMDRLTVETEPEPLARSTSTSSSLEYYFSIPTDPSPIPPLPIFEQQNVPPSRNPVESLPNPTSDSPSKNDDDMSAPGGFEETLKAGKSSNPNHAIGELIRKEMNSPIDEDERGSPWTIEAVDGDLEEDRDKALDLMDVAPRIRTRSSAASESGGEEILYPRQVPSQPFPIKEPGPFDEREEGNTSSTSSARLSAPHSRKALLSPARKAHKRSSDDFASGQGDSPAGSGSEKPTSQRPSTSGGASTSGRSRDKRRDRQSEMGLPSASGARVGRPRPQSANMSSLAHDGVHQHRRGASSRESSIPKSPTRSISNLALTRSKGSLTTHHVGSTSSVHKEKDSVNSPRVAHSLLRGTQEGWSALDDEATAEALRKLDGVSGKSMRARASISSIGRISLQSRPASPGSSKNIHAYTHTRGESEMTTGDSRANESSLGLSNLPVTTKEMDKSDKETLAITGASDGEPTRYHSGDELPQPEKEMKKGSIYGSSLHFTAKRGSVSSTTYTGTPTTSSRDSGSLSTTTAATSISATSGRVSSGKTRRNSTSSDVSSVHSSDATSQRDRAALLISGESTDVIAVPPVPPLPKDLSSFKSPPQSSCSAAFPLNEVSQDAPRIGHHPTSSDVPSIGREAPPPELDSAVTDTSPSESEYTHIQTVTIPTTVASPPMKTPNKKWSLSSALSLKRTSSPNSSRKSASILSPYSNKSATKDISTYGVGTPKSNKSLWSPVQKDAMASAASLASLSSLGSVMESSVPPSPSTALSGSTNRGGEQQRLDTGTVHAVNLRTVSSDPAQQPRGSPSSKSHREISSKRLTPSSTSIPFFRRSSSQSMQIQTDNDALSSTSVRESRRSLGKAPANDVSLSSPSGTTSHRKSSVLSLGLPSLLKGSSSRRSLQAEKSEASSRETDKQSSRKDQSSGKKSDKEKSEGQGRLSSLMVRKRGKTVSSTEPKKAKPIDLPPFQMSAIPTATTEKLANLKPGPRTSLTSSPSAPGVSTSRVSSQTISSMQKQADRSSRHQQLPTIAGSPSVNVHSTSGTNSGSRESKLHRSNTNVGASLSSSMAGLPKETPTRIPRIASRSSTLTTPPLKGSKAPLSSSRRASLNVGSSTVTELGEIDVEGSNEFGVIQPVSESGAKTTSHRHSHRLSPSTIPSHARLSHGHTGSAIEATARRLTRDSTSLASLRKSSTGSVAGSSLTSKGEKDVESRHLALSPSKSLSKLLSPKLSLTGSRLSTSSGPNLHIASSHSSWRQSITTPSPAPSPMDDDEILGDEEMMQYIKRQQAKRLANGAKKEEIEEMFSFPEPQPPGRPMSPNSIINSEMVANLADYERKEILDYPAVYYFGNITNKKAATRDNSTNNYGYDDDRGDYIIHNHDHLAYRYEIMDTLGKGSFGQVLRCRDHCTGQSVAIKIIRNKKRFHHQALVEIKILDNLRKWDPDEKHHVIKMTENFYFRNHLCIAMELLSINLYELIKANSFSGFSTTLIRRFTNQMLMSLCLMRHHRIVHCDLKPENVLLRHPAKSAIKVIDFGSSCFENEKVYTYIQSRFYRSPEVILGMNYNMAIDMWSLGCILAELYTGYPIFPGENEQEQLSCIMEVLGVPDKDLINRSSRKRLFFDSTGAPRPVVNSKGRRRRAGTKTLAQVLRCDDELFVDFIAKCLHWDPERRLKPHSAMRHPFVTAGRRPKSVAASVSYTHSRLVPGSPGSSGSRKLPTETPKKSQISAPTPLTARSVKATVPSIPTTPNGPSSHLAHGSAVKSYRTNQSTTFSRTVNGLAVASAK